MALLAFAFITKTKKNERLYLHDLNKLTTDDHHSPFGYKGSTYTAVLRRQRLAK